MFLDVLKDTVLDCLKLLPFLLAAYLAIEIIEDRAEDKTVALIHRAGKWGPVMGSALGIVPQCGFSAATSNLYAGGLITRGTLLAVFLSTSDEMLPILVSSSASAGFIVKVLLYKMAVGLIVGILVDTLESRLFSERHKSIHDMCEKEGCHCEDGVIKSALRHTGKIIAFLFIVTLLVNFAVESIGTERLSGFIMNRPVFGQLLAGIVGLVPNCAASVVLTTLYLQGVLPASAMISGLLVGSGVGLLVLVRMNHDKKDSLITLGLLYVSGVLFGILAEALRIF